MWIPHGVSSGEIAGCGAADGEMKGEMWRPESMNSGWVDGCGAAGREMKRKMRTFHSGTRGRREGCVWNGGRRAARRDCAIDSRGAPAGPAARRQLSVGV